MIYTFTEAELQRTLEDVAERAYEKGYAAGKTDSVKQAQKPAAA